MSTNLLVGRTVLSNDPTGCWLFTGARTSAGYGTLRLAGRTTYAHRYSYEVYNGPIPESTVIHHTCAVRICVNPSHLQAVTPQENSAEMLERQTFIRSIESLELQLESFAKIVADLEAENEELTNLVAEMREILEDL